MPVTRFENSVLVSVSVSALDPSYQRFRSVSLVSTVPFQASVSVPVYLNM